MSFYSVNDFILVSYAASKPAIENGFGKAILKEGMRLVLECRVHGKPTPEIKWFLDGRRVTSGNRVHLSVLREPDTDVTDGTDNDLMSRLIVDQMATHDGGDYSCVAKNKAGSASHTARIHVRGPPAIRPFRNITAVAGSTVRIKCYVTGYPIDKVIWTKGQLFILLSIY